MGPHVRVPFFRFLLVLGSVVGAWAVALDRAAADLLCFPHLGFVAAESHEIQSLEATGLSTLDWALARGGRYDHTWGAVPLLRSFDFGLGNGMANDVSLLIRSESQEPRDSDHALGNPGFFPAFADLDEVDEFQELGDDGLIVNQTLLLKGSEVRFDSLAAKPMLGGGVLAGDGPNPVLIGSQQSINVGMMGRIVIPGSRKGLTQRQIATSMSETFFFDWPWSTRQGRNMFFWVVGPPALVFVVVLAIAVFLGVSRPGQD